MLAYWIGGADYNQILVNIHKDKNTPVVEQYYVQFGNIVRRSKVKYWLGYENGVVLDHIETDDKDTIVLPKYKFVAVSPYAVRGCGFKRLVVPLKMAVTFRSKSLWGSDALEDFLSLSRDVIYESDVFADSVVRRTY